MLLEPRFLDDGDIWLLAEEIPDIDFQFSQIWLSSFVNDLRQTIGINYQKVLSVYDGCNLRFYYGEQDSERVSRVILEKIVSDDFGIEINANIRRVADELFRASEEIDRDSVLVLGNNALSEFYAGLDAVHTAFYAWAWLPNAVDMFHAHLTDHLRAILARHTAVPEEINAALVALSFHEEKSFVQEESESLLRIAAYQQDNPADVASVEGRLQRHRDEYFYLKHLWIGKEGVSTIDDYRHALEDVRASGNPKEVLEAEHTKWTADRRLRDEYEKRLSLSAAERRLFRTYAEFAFTKAYRRRAQLFWAYRMGVLFEALSARLGISRLESRFLLPSEVHEGLVSGLSEEKKVTISARTAHCVYYAEEGLDIVAVGDACMRFEQKITAAVDHDVDEFTGQVACMGTVRGVAKVVNSVSDIHKVNEGDVLVSIATNPDILPAMKRAAAFITDQGGITSHAAIVAREMKTPCVIGTRIATKVLKDGDVVEVDATRGVVRVIRG